jgi:23S rRNA-/tRNA-specific pseudouridylate synthase
VTVVENRNAEHCRPKPLRRVMVSSVRFPPWWSRRKQDDFTASEVQVQVESGAAAAARLFDFLASFLILTKLCLLWLLMPSLTKLTSRATWSKVPLYIDRGVIVLNKPPGLVCQPSDQVSEDVTPEFGAKLMRF